eukprot:TRINITY_DN7868_c0_g1_i1.p1 TRINITY_DN7868_c0_g1~~TRINITY_DN7868_c0_g1_i1.p1  ORF type:complete len:997 (+),score=313.57 TRINITY_DN7868_c0_g1_i1:150-3140(+)
MENHEASTQEDSSFSFSLKGLELEDSLERDLALLARKTERKEKDDQKQTEEKRHSSKRSTKTMKGREEKPVSYEALETLRDLAAASTRVKKGSLSPSSSTSPSLSLQHAWTASSQPSYQREREDFEEDLGEQEEREDRGRAASLATWNTLGSMGRPRSRSISTTASSAASTFASVSTTSGLTGSTSGMFFTIDSVIHRMSAIIGSCIESPNYISAIINEFSSIPIPHDSCLHGFINALNLIFREVLREKEDARKVVKENTSLIKQLEERDERIAHIQSMLARSQHAEDELARMKEELKTTCSDVSKTMRSFEHQSASERERETAIRSKLTSELKLSRERCETLENDLCRTIEVESLLRSEIVDLNGRIETLTEDKTSVECDLERLQHELTLLRDVVREREEEDRRHRDREMQRAVDYEIVQESLKGAKLTNETLSRSMEDLKTQLDEKTHTIEDLSSLNMRLTSQIRTIEKEKDDLQRKLENMEREFSDIMKHTEETKSLVKLELDDAKKRLVQATAENRDLRQRWENDRDALTSKHKNERQEFQASIEEVKRLEHRFHTLVRKHHAEWKSILDIMCQSCEDAYPTFPSDQSISVEPMLGDDRKSQESGVEYGKKRDDKDRRDKDDSQDEEEIEPSVLVDEPIGTSLRSSITSRMDEDSLMEDVRSCDAITELLVRVREQWEHLHDDELPRIRDLKKRNELLLSQRTQLEDEINQMKRTVEKTISSFEEKIIEEERQHEEQVRTLKERVIELESLMERMRNEKEKAQDESRKLSMDLLRSSMHDDHRNVPRSSGPPAPSMPKSMSKSTPKSGVLSRKWGTYSRSSSMMDQSSSSSSPSRGSSSRWPSMRESLSDDLVSQHVDEEPKAESGSSSSILQKSLPPTTRLSSSSSSLVSPVKLMKMREERAECDEEMSSIARLLSMNNRIMNDIRSVLEETEKEKETLLRAREELRTQYDSQHDVISMGIVEHKIAGVDEKILRLRGEGISLRRFGLPTR